MSKIVSEFSFKSWEYTVKRIFTTRSLTTSSDSNSANKNYDIVVVGGGIVGVATAREIINRHSNLRMALLEKETQLANHQTGHNSGVVHAGIYYQPGSLKAKLCVEGAQLSYKYFDSKKIPYKKCGKLIVATNPEEIKKLKDLYARAITNKVPDIQYIEGEKAIKAIEPLCTGLEALWSPHTGIVDWALVTKYYAADFVERKGNVFLNFAVNGFHESKNPDYPIKICSTTNNSVNAKYVLTCGGLQSDRLAVMSGCSKNPKIVPFRGEYLVLRSEKARLIKTNVYPVPDPRFPFLGVHVTPRMDGSVWLGPNAVLAFRREGYKWSDIHFGELLETITYPGFIKLGFKYLIPGAMEMIKSRIVSLQLRDVQKFLPTVTKGDIEKKITPAGVRAQALDGKGNLVDDFVFDKNTSGGPTASRILHCRNAPSPGATSSLAIAKMIAERCETEFNLKELISK
ncbi:L-2-hydroxyglutarate dehydrogenase, mitochondrial isoform X1 [Diorhabda sublineata]|uniref:L-2-hydroxyglutarate dehydrogenase, mitochondrial isoform X1 n=2 Tax=Diorhabda sublineata TaxID=1163346 RepID=UPI0024E0A73E|nr:L-2-hydroxyglutarate dehydrogenase, mitochondrial isoform X1 [Diorhabda sublineata]